MRVVTEVVHFHPAPLYQGLQAVVHLAQAHAHLARQLALADVGCLLEYFQNFVVGIFSHVLC